MTIENAAQSLSKTLIICVLVSMSGCSAGEDWEHEVILQLYKSAQLDVPKIDVEAGQEGNEGRVTIEDTKTFFGSCADNRVRLISQTGNEGMSEIDVTITAGKFQVTRKIQSLGKVEIVIGNNTADLIPTCPGTRPTPDAAVDAPLGSTGDPCAKGTDCKGGLCLHVLWNSIEKVTMRGGYCSASCEELPCVNPAEERCYTARYASNEPEGYYCLKRCENSPCRDGYTCTEGEPTCVPRPSD